MVSAALDTVPGKIVMGIAYLSSMQKRAYEEIMKAYPKSYPLCKVFAMHGTNASTNERSPT